MIEICLLNFSYMDQNYSLKSDQVAQILWLKIYPIRN